MDFSINYSQQAACLLTHNQIQTDRFKCPDWPDLIAEAMRLRPVAVHFGLQIGNSSIENADWDLITRQMLETNTPFVNFHLEPVTESFPGIPIDSTQPSHREHVVEELIRELNLAASIMGPENVIIENIPYRFPSRQALRLGAEPSVITRILEETDCGLLLDISHARISAHSLEMDLFEYMQQLPTNKLREIHFTGLHQIEGKLQDHLEVLESDWPVLDWVMEQVKGGVWSRPWMLAFEYGGVGEKFAWRSNPEVIREQVPRLYQAVKRI